MSSRTATVHEVRRVLRHDDGDPGPLEPPPPESEGPPPALLFEAVADVAHHVDNAPAPRFLARPVLIEDVHGVIGAEDKAGKSWAITDLAVAVASGGSWLGQYPCEVPGPVTMLLGEATRRKTIRRLRAIGLFYGVNVDELPIRLCHRAPNLTRADHLEAIAYELEHHPPRLVILDPLYLSLGKTNSSILAEVGNALGPIQYECQKAGAAFIVVHHWNKTGSGTDRHRFTGSGTAEWGRVLVSVAVTDSDVDDAETIVRQRWKFIGDEIPDTTLNLERRVRAEDPDDLQSPMRYSVGPPSGARVVADDTDRAAELRTAICAVLADGEELSGNALIGAVRESGVNARDQDVRRVALSLADGGPVRLRLGQRNAQMFRLEEVPA